MEKKDPGLHTAKLDTSDLSDKTSCNVTFTIPPSPDDDGTIFLVSF